MLNPLKNEDDCIPNFAYILAILIKTVNPKVHGDVTQEILEDFLNGMADGAEIMPEDAINIGRAILATEPGPSSYMN